MGLIAHNDMAVDVNKIREAIGQFESGGNYNAKGPLTKGDRAYGKYQVMGSNVPNWTKEALGKSLTPQQFLQDKNAQDTVAHHKMNQLAMQYNNPQDVASTWFSGKPTSKAGNAKDVIGTSVPKYVANVTKNYNSMPTSLTPEQFNALGGGSQAKTLTPDEFANLKPLNSHFITSGAAPGAEPPVQGFGANFADELAHNTLGVIGNAAKSGVEQIGEGFKQASQPTGPVQGLEASLKMGAGAVNTAFSPLAPIFKPVSNVVDWVANNAGKNPLGGSNQKGLADTSQFQNFANSKAGETTSRVAEDVENLATIAQGVAGSKFLKEGAVNSELAGKIRENAVEKQAGFIDEKLGLGKNTRAAIAQRKATAITGAKTPGQVLAENNIPFDNNASVALEPKNIILGSVKQAILKSEGKWGSLDDAAAQAKENLNLTGTDLIKGRAIIDQELKAYKAQFTRKGQVVDGKLKLPLDQADRVKSGLWKQSFKKGLIRSDSIANDARYAFGNALKTMIENTSESDVVKDLNRQQGDIINAQRTLADKDVTKLGKPSLPSRIARQAVGAVIGSVGGPVGSILGAGSADYIGEILHNANIPSAFRQSLIDNLKETPEGRSVLQKAQATLDERMQKQIKTPQLKENKTIFAPDKYENAPNKGSTTKVYSGETIQQRLNTKALPQKASSEVIKLPAKTQSTLDQIERGNIKRIGGKGSHRYIPIRPPK